MQTTGTITLQQGIGKASGKPYTALKLKIGKWSQLHFPTPFETEYLVNYLKENQGTITLDPNTERLILTAGDYSYFYTVESKFEYKYIVDYFRNSEKTSTPHSEDDDKIDLENDEPTDNGMFN